MADNSFQIFIKDLKDKTLVIDVKSSDTIKDITYKINKRNGIPIHEQILIWAGKKLKNDLTIKDYQIKKESTIYLVLRLNGGTNMY